MALPAGDRPRADTCVPRPINSSFVTPFGVPDYWPYRIGPCRRADQVCFAIYKRGRERRPSAIPPASAIPRISVWETVTSCLNCASLHRLLNPPILAGPGPAPRPYAAVAHRRPQYVIRRSASPGTCPSKRGRQMEGPPVAFVRRVRCCGRQCSGLSHLSGPGMAASYSGARWRLPDRSPFRG
jgi:hypothetical protein